MARLNINIGTTANDRKGDPLRTAFDKVNKNFIELYNLAGADVQIPTQTGNNGKFLTTNGTTLSWSSISQEVGTANTGFVDDRIYNINGVTVSNDDLVHGATGRVSIPAYGSTDDLNLLNYYGAVSITTGTGPSNTKGWTFGSDGKFNLPNASTDGAYIQSTSHLQFVSNTKKWSFDDTGVITLPDGGDIVNIHGTSVLGTGGATSLNELSDVSYSLAGIMENDTLKWSPLSGQFINGRIKWSEIDLAPTIPTDVNQLSDADGLLAGGANVTESDTPPGTPAAGDLWFDTIGGRLYIYFSNTWVDASPTPAYPTDISQLTDNTHIIKTNLSSFINDLSIAASSLTGSTLASGITGSSLTSVGTLTGVTSSGIVHITNTTDSTNADTGALQVDGGAHITKNLIAEGTIYAGVNAYSEALTNPLIVASAPSGVSGGYSQVAILNNTAEASGDFQVMIDGYDVNVSDTGWADLGMAGSNFSDPRYTITQPGDGYVFASGLEGSTAKGNLVLATDNSGQTNDIVFATGGFLTENEVVRIKNLDGSLNIGSGKIVSQNEVAITSIDKTWTFGTDGYLTGESLYLQGYLKGVDGSTGTTGQVLTRQSNGGVAWADAASGGSTYTLPTASTSTLGGVKVDGSTIVIDGSGVISSTVVGAVTLKGTWDASTNTPTLSSSLPAGVALGWQYLVSVTGTRDIGNGSQTYNAGDIVMYDGVNWVDIPGAAGSVASFNSRTGVVTLSSNDVTTALGFTPYNATNPNSYITASALSGYATESFVTSQGYITSSGNAATATALQTARNINGVPFDGTGNITVTAAASTLTGSTLNAGVTQSSLTSVGTLTNLTVTNPISGSVTGSAGSVAGTNITGTTLASGITSSSLTSVGTLANLTVTNTITGSVSGNAGTVTNGVYTTDTGTVTNTMLAGSIANNKLANSSMTLNGTLVNLGDNVTLDAAANLLLGSTLASNVTASSLTSVGTLTGLTVSGTMTRSGNISSAAWTTAGVGFKLPAATYTDTSSSGSVANNFINYIGVPTIASSSATTVSTAANLYIAGDPAAGANTTIAGGYGLYNAGKTYFQNAVRFNGALQSGGGAQMMTFSNSTISMTPGTASTSYTTGTLVVTGGVGISGNVNTNGYVAQAALPAFRVYGSGSTTITVGTVLTSSHFTLDYQQGGTNLVVSTGIFTAPVAGLYQINLVARAYSNAGIASQVAVVKNPSGTALVMCMVEWAANTTVNHIGASTVAKLAAGDTLVAKVLLGSAQFDSNDNWSVAFLG